MTRTPRRLTALFLLALVVIPRLCVALPLESRVPGGIALIRLGNASADETPPRAWLGEQPVWVTRDGAHWVAVLGIALDAQPGTAGELRVSDGSTLRFEIGQKHYPEQRIKLKDTGKVTLSPADEARAVQEIAHIQRLKRHWREVADTETDSDFVLPADGRLTSRFGLRRFFNGEPRAPHNGLDIAVPRGTAVKANAAGKVLAVDDFFFNGKTVFIDHGNGLISMACHLDRIDVQTGQSVARGELIGRSGMTGRASGPHVHWSIVLNGVMVDPALFLK